MKTTDNNQNKKFTELSDEDLKQVTGGASIDCSLPENKDNIICNAKLKRQPVTLQGGNWGEFQLDSQYITETMGRVCVIE